MTLVRQRQQERLLVRVAAQDPVVVHPRGDRGGHRLGHFSHVGQRSGTVGVVHVLVRRQRLEHGGLLVVKREHERHLVAIKLYLQLGSLILARTRRYCCSSHCRRDYIFTLVRGVSHFEPLGPTPRYRLVVEPSPVRSLAADCPILTLFKP